MKVLLLPADRSGCAFYRMSEPARAVQEAYPDVEIEISHHLDVDGEYVTGSNEPTRISSVDPHGADVVVFQRPSNRAFPQAIRKLKEMGVAVVVEIDDLLHGVSVEHPGYRELVANGGGNRIIDCARQADLVTVSTPALARIYGTHCPSRVIRNAIPRRLAELPPAYERSPEVATIGWTGSVFTHPHDLQMMGSGLRTALQNTQGRSKFVIFGQATGAKERLSLPGPVPEIMWISDPEAYLRALGQMFEIGVAPLRMDTFNEKKSWLKPLEYASRGVYPVRSITPEYARLDIGRFARSPKDWGRELTRAVLDPDMRREFAARERERVLADHLLDNRVEQWVEAWRTAADIAARARTGTPVS